MNDGQGFGLLVIGMMIGCILSGVITYSATTKGWEVESVNEGHAEYVIENHEKKWKWRHKISSGQEDTCPTIKLPEIPDPKEPQGHRPPIDPRVPRCDKCWR